jgi:P27 family predicted phage terminase small subunit
MNRPKPTALKRLQGNPGKRPLNPDEPEPERLPAGAVAPDWLTGEARARWDALAAELEPLGLLTAIDADALAAYCKVWARWREAEENIDKFGQVFKTPAGYIAPTPYLSIANKALTHIRHFEVEFGMTPSSRSRVHAMTAKPKKSKAERFMAETPALRVVK